MQSHLVSQPKQSRPGRPRKGAAPDRFAWQIEATVTVEQEAVSCAVQRKASFLVAPNVLNVDQLPDRDLIQTYKDQGTWSARFMWLMQHRRGRCCSVSR